MWWHQSGRPPTPTTGEGAHHGAQGHHVELGYALCREHGETPLVAERKSRAEPTTDEEPNHCLPRDLSLVVTAADATSPDPDRCAGRRARCSRVYVKRLEKLEEIADSIYGTEPVAASGSFLLRQIHLSGFSYSFEVRGHGEPGKVFVTRDARKLPRRWPPLSRTNSSTRADQVVGGPGDPGGLGISPLMGPPVWQLSAGAGRLTVVEPGEGTLCGRFRTGGTRRGRRWVPAVASSL